MLGVVGIVALLTTLGLSLVITRVATVALTMTGLSEESARFQARSAFTGTGFTTSEAETVVNHPVRRRIIMLLMIVRSAGLVTIVLSLILSFVGSPGETAKITRLGWMLAGMGIIWFLAGSKKLDIYMTRVIKWALAKWTDLDVRDYASLLRLSGEYTVMEVRVEEGDWIAGKNLKKCYLPEEGITVLGINRSDGSYVGGPKGETKVYAGDTLIVYGRVQKLKNLDKRRADAKGDIEHDFSVNEQKSHLEEQERREREHEQKRESGLIR